MPTVKILPGNQGFKMLRGDDYAMPFTIKENDVAVDVSDRTYTAQLRRTPNGELVEDFTVDMTSAATGIIVLSLADTVTAELSGGYVWDLQQETAGGVIRTLAGGAFEVLLDVTRAA